MILYNNNYNNTFLMNIASVVVLTMSSHEKGETDENERPAAEWKNIEEFQ